MSTRANVAIALLSDDKKALKVMIILTNCSMCCSKMNLSQVKKTKLKNFGEPPTARFWVNPESAALLCKGFRFKNG